MVMAEDMLAALRAVIADTTEIENPHDLGPHDNLFEHGLTSLETVRVLLAIEERFDMHVPDSLLIHDPQDLFRNLESLAQAIISARIIADAPASASRLPGPSEAGE
jgi:acyl carrier protein